MKVIKRAKLDDFFKAHQQGKKPLLKWYEVARKVRWKSLKEMRATFPSADEVVAASGRKAVVFNIKNNDYRLITAVHYEKTVQDQDGRSKIVEGKVFLFFFLTHAEYDKEYWKAHL